MVAQMIFGLILVWLGYAVWSHHSRESAGRGL